MLKASIIILSYNQSNILEYTLYSLSKQITSHEFEVIITDDGSSIDNINKIFGLISEYQKLKISFIFQQDTGYNITRAKNNAIRMARNDIIITLDGDILPDYDFVEAHMSLHEKHKSILVYTNRKYKNFNELNFRNPFSQSKDSKNIQIERDEIEMKDKSVKGWQKAWGFSTSFKKTRYTLYNERFTGWGLEDIEFAYRLEKIHGYRLLKTDAILFHVNQENEKLNNPYITKDKHQLELFIKNAITFIVTFGKNSHEFIKLLYIPNIISSDTSLRKSSISFYNRFKKELRNTVSLHKDAIKCLKKLL